MTRNYELGGAHVIANALIIENMNYSNLYYSLYKC